MAKTASAKATSKPVKAAMKMAATTSPVTPAKAEKKKGGKKKSKFKIVVNVHLENRIWIVGVANRKDGEFYSIECANKKVEVLYKAWLREHAKSYPNFSVSVYCYDTDGDPVLMMIQAT